MAWIAIQSTMGQIDKAGKMLVDLPVYDVRRDDALEVINNWRSCHGYPLHVITNTLISRAQSKVKTNALIARRIKRLPSISLKLRHNPAMKLSKMQDIGGCRAVLNSIREVEQLVDVYAKAQAKHPEPTDRPALSKVFDYISAPKPDGYRSVHLIMIYQSRSHSKKQWNGRRVEIQIRSKLQHAWATAVETCQTFTGWALKSKVKAASSEWLRFFALMSSAIADIESRPLVPGTPQNKAELRSEITEIAEREKIISSLQVWGAAAHHPKMADDHESAAFLLELNSTRRLLTMRAYKLAEMPTAHRHYLAREKETESDPNIQVVLVSAGSIANLRRAYPNFYMDTQEFIKVVRQVMKK